MPQVLLEEAKRHLSARRSGPGSSQANDKTFLLLHNAASFQAKLLGAANVFLTIPHAGLTKFNSRLVRK
jgi:hypothetical protein